MFDISLGFVYYSITDAKGGSETPQPQQEIGK
jgi:hypothetical protein